MSVLTDLRSRGVKDVFFLVCDGLKGLFTMQSVFGDADAPMVVELAQKPDLQGVPGGRARDPDRGAAAVPRRLGAAGTGDRGTNKAEAYNGFSPGARFGNQGVIAE